MSKRSETTITVPTTVGALIEALYGQDLDAPVNILQNFLGQVCIAVVREPWDDDIIVAETPRPERLA